MNDKFVPLESGDTISKVKGILVRPFPITSALDLAYIGVTADQVGDNLKRGYICVVSTAGNATTAKKGDPVYVRVAGGTHSKPGWLLCVVAGLYRIKYTSAAKCRGHGAG